MYSAGEKSELYLISTYLSELLVAENLCEINIIFSLYLCFSCIENLRQSKKKEAEIEKGIDDLFKYASTVERRQ